MRIGVANSLSHPVWWGEDIGDSTRGESLGISPGWVRAERKYRGGEESEGCLPCGVNGRACGLDSPNYSLK